MHRGPTMRSATFVLAVGLAAFSAAADGADPPGFERDIRPILEKNCTGCHNARSKASGLVLESEAGLLEGGSVNGPALIPGKSFESRRSGSLAEW